MDLATLALHEPYTASKSIVIGDGTRLSIANIGSFTLTSFPTPLLFTNVLHVPAVRPEKFQFLEKGQNSNFDYKIVNFD